MIMKDKITMRQKKFVRETIKTLNPTEGARRSYNLGGKGGKDNDKTAKSIAAENLAKPVVRIAFKDMLAKIDEQPLIDELEKIAYAPEDKRAKITAIQELFKLKDLYPKDKTKVIGLFERIESMRE